MCLSLPLRLPNGTTLFIPPGATLKAGSILQWPNTTTHFNFMELRHQQDIAVVGGGVIDGSGEQWWPAPPPRPRIFHAVATHNTIFRDVQLVNSGAMSMVFGTPCSKVTRRAVTNPTLYQHHGAAI